MINHMYKYLPWRLLLLPIFIAKKDFAKPTNISKSLLLPSFPPPIRFKKPLAPPPELPPWVNIWAIEIIDPMSKDPPSPFPSRPKMLDIKEGSTPFSLAWFSNPPLIEKMKSYFNFQACHVIEFKEAARNYLGGQLHTLLPTTHVLGILYK